MAIETAGEPDKPAKPRVKGEDEVALEEEGRMREYFSKQKRVTIKTREDEWVQVNGYTFIIKAGERVEVPEDVALLLEQAGRI